MASLRRLLWTAVKVDVLTPLLSQAVGLVQQKAKDFLLMRLVSLGGVLRYTVFTESSSWRATLRALQTLLLTPPPDWQIAFRDADGQWWYRTYNGKPPPQ